MQYWRPAILMIMVALSITACGRASLDQAVNVQEQQRLEGAQDTHTTGKPTVPALPGTIVAATEVVMPNASPNTCAVTRPSQPPFRPPPPYSRYAPSPGEFWYGTDMLWTAIPGTGEWSGLPQNEAGYTQKVFWWSKSYSSTGELEPQLSVTGRLLNAPAPPLNVSKATNAFAEDIQSAMLVVVDFPMPGCWEIWGRYADTDLSFVIRVAP